MTTKYFLISLLMLVISACTENNSETDFSLGDNAATKRDSKMDSTGQMELKANIEIEKTIKQVALSFHQWNIESILNESETITNDFDIIKSPNGKCKLDSTSYFNNLRKLGTISEKFIQSEWRRVKKCTKFLETLDWKDYESSDAYEYQEYCDIYTNNWTRTQEPFHGVEVKNLEKINDYYRVTLIFYFKYDKKDYSEQFMPWVKVEEEKGKWKITEIAWLQK